ncbi:MFS transporter [Streptosporangium sp. NPDC000396]|uniref:MFS transporter n=1 Tax=Streptosporangium sp. NPDC000396 TaxID=3366185 RepID=UPI0036BCCDCF
MDTGPHLGRVGPSERSSGERRVVANILRGSVGNLIEWYDWYTYAAFAIYFAPVFFPKGDSTAQLLNTAAIFAVGFLMRPLGGWLLGRYADRYGRRNGLTLSVLMMAAGSLIITVAPGHASVGILAPVLLVAARLLQGLSVGGEYSTSATYLSEVATPGKRGFYSSFQYVTLVAGQLVALTIQIILQQVLTAEQLQDWGWRIAFGIGTLGALAVMWLRRGMEESESFTNQNQAGEPTQGQGTLRTLMKYPKEVFTVVGLTLGGTVAFYTYTTYMQKFMVNTAGIEKETVSWINFLALLVFICLQPIAGALSDRIGRRALLMFFGVGGTLLTVPILTFLSGTKSPVGAFFLMLAALFFVTGYTSINAVVKAEMFPTHVRALGVGLPYAVTVALFGGTAEYVALWFKQAGNESLFFWYVAGCVLISLIVYVRMWETSRSSHIDRQHSKATTAS